MFFFFFILTTGFQADYYILLIFMDVCFVCYLLLCYGIVYIWIRSVNQKNYKLFSLFS